MILTQLGAYTSCPKGPAQPEAQRKDPQRWCRWIVLWKEAGPTDKACNEAHAESSGRFDGACFARYGHVVNGFAVEVRGRPYL